MREHLLSLLICAAAAAGLLATSAGCREEPVQLEPIAEPGPIPLNKFVRAWATQLDIPADDAVKELHPREGNLFVYTRAGQVLTVARDSGQLKWVAQIRSTDRAGMRPPVVLKDRVIVPTSSTLEVYEPTEGGFLKQVPLRVAARSNAVGTGTLVFLGGDNEGAGRVVALDVTQQYVHTVWQLMIPKGGLQSTPALYEDALFIGGGDGNVYAVAAVNREALWPLKDNAFKTEGPIVADLAADETGVYVASTDSRFYCLNRGTGRLKWQYYAGRPLTEDPVLTATQVYLPLPGVGMAAFDKTEGAFNREPLWIAQGMSQFLTEDERHVYLRRAADNVAVAVDKRTGEQRFESNRRDLTVFATSKTADGVIYAASKTNRLLAIKPVLKPGVVGELVWAETDITDQAVALAR